MQTKRPRRPRELHPRLFRRPAPLPVIARMTTSHQILPGSLTRPRPWNHMIQRQLPRRHRPMTILARVSVAHQNILPRQRPRLMWNSPILQQPNHRRHPHRRPRRMNMVRRMFLGRRHALQHQHQRPPRRTHVDRLIAGVQHEHRFMQPIKTWHVQSSPTLTNPQPRDTDVDPADPRAYQHAPA